MKTHAQYITDEKGKKKAVIFDIKEYKKLLHALEELEDKKAFLSVVRETAIPYVEIEARLKKSKRFSMYSSASFSFSSIKISLKRLF
jgi:hypothetical protein